MTAQNFIFAAAQLSLARRLPFSRLHFFEFIVMFGSMFAHGVKWADVEDDDVSARASVRIFAGKWFEQSFLQVASIRPRMLVSVQQPQRVCNLAADAQQCMVASYLPAAHEVRTHLLVQAVQCECRYVSVDGAFRVCAYLCWGKPSSMILRLFVPVHLCRTVPAAFGQVITWLCSIAT